MNFYLYIIFLASISTNLWIFIDEICITGNKFIAIIGITGVIISIIGLFILGLLEIGGNK